MNTCSILCSLRRVMRFGPDWPLRRLCTIIVKRMRGQPNPVSSLFAPVKLATTFGSHWRGSVPAFHAIVPSTKYSGMVCTIATIASANPLLIENSDASAAHAIRSEAAMTAPNVEIATAYSCPGANNVTRMEARIQMSKMEYSKTSLVLTGTLSEATGSAERV